MKNATLPKQAADLEIVHVRIEEIPFGVRHHLLVEGEEVTVGGCATWTDPEVAVDYYRGTKAFAEIFAAVLADDSNFLGADYQSKFGAAV